jgi:GNAT superfamily N-acetyltransferase
LGVSGDRGLTVADGSRRSKAIAADLRCISREFGWQAALRRLLGWASYAIYRREDRLVIRKTLSESPSVTDSARDVRVERAESRHLPMLTEFNRRHCNARAMRRHAQVRGDREAMLAFVGKELVGYLWWMDQRSARDDIDVVRLGPAVDEDDVYAFEMFVAPERRAHGTASSFVTGACDQLAQLGYRRVWGFVDHDNVPARWLYSTNGWSTVRRSRSWHLLSRLAVIDGIPYLAVNGRVKRLRRPHGSMPR